MKRPTDRGSLIPFEVDANWDERGKNKGSVEQLNVDKVLSLWL